MQAQREGTQRKLYSIGSRLGLRWAFKACVGHYLLVLGIIGSHWGFTLGPQGFSDNNMLVSATQKSHVGGTAQREGVQVRVEYRPNVIKPLYS